MKVLDSVNNVGISQMFFKLFIFIHLTLRFVEYNNKLRKLLWEIGRSHTPGR